MNRKIRIAPPHIYLDEYDISAFVSGYEVKGPEHVTVELLGDVVMPDMPAKPKKKAKIKKVILHGDG